MRLDYRQILLRGWRLIYGKWDLRCWGVRTCRLQDVLRRFLRVKICLITHHLVGLRLCVSASNTWAVISLGYGLRLHPALLQFQSKDRPLLIDSLSDMLRLWSSSRHGIYLSPSSDETLLEHLSQRVVAAQLLDGHPKSLLIVNQTLIKILKELVFHSCIVKGCRNYLNELTFLFGVGIAG